MNQYCTDLVNWSFFSRQEPNLKNRLQPKLNQVVFCSPMNRFFLKTETTPPIFLELSENVRTKRLKVFNFKFNFKVTVYGPNTNFVHTISANEVTHS